MIGPAGLYVLLIACLIAVVALAAVFSSSPVRRKATLAVLALLTQRRDRSAGRTSGPAKCRKAHRPAEPPILPRRWTGE